MRWRRRYGPHLKAPTPIYPTLPLFDDSAEFMAGALRDQVTSFIRSQQIILTLDDDSESDFRIDVNHEIHISLGKLERLWATLFAYTVVHDLQKSGRGLVDMESSPEGRAAKEFLDWAFGDASRSWPASLPRPSDGTGLTKNTDHLFRFCSGFILLHEVGHCIHKHPSNPATNPKTKIRREYQADDWAMKVIIGGQSDKVSVHYWTAIAMTLGLIGALELYGEKGDKRNHPRPVTRMRHFFTEHFWPTGPNQTVQSGVLAAMMTPVQAHLIRKGYPTLAAYRTMGDFWNAADAAYPS